MLRFPRTYLTILCVFPTAPNARQSLFSASFLFAIISSFSPPRISSSPSFSGPVLQSISSSSSSSLLHPFPFLFPFPFPFPFFFWTIQQIFNRNIHYMTKTAKPTFNRIESISSITLYTLIQFFQSGIIIGHIIHHKITQIINNAIFFHNIINKFGHILIRMFFFKLSDC